MTTRFDGLELGRGRAILGVAVDGRKRAKSRPRPDAAIFADTGMGTRRRVCPPGLAGNANQWIPIYRVSNGRNRMAIRGTG